MISIMCKKKLLVPLLCTLFVMLLCSCSSNKTETVYTVSNDGTYVIDSSKGTVSDGTHIYKYKINGSSSDYTVYITYPNGSQYWRSARSEDDAMSYSEGWSESYDEKRYIDGAIICNVLEGEVPKDNNPLIIILSVILLGVGVFYIVTPQTLWYLEYGWRYKDAEPSDLAIGWNRFAGIVLIIVAVAMFLVQILK